MSLKLYHTKGVTEVGCDEAGRGCLAGPVYAAAVILPKKFKSSLLNDSKLLSESNRLFLRDYVINHAIEWAVGSVSESEIDKINILNASFLAMHRALDQMKTPIESVLVDGNRFKPYKNVPSHCIVKGDGKYMSIAAASILAKTFRDDFMIKIDKEFPIYDWKKNKGYPTAIHRQRIQEYGVVSYHRKSFKLMPNQLSLSL